MKIAATLLALMLSLTAAGFPGAAGAAAPPPIAVTGIDGVTFLAKDAAPLLEFYGRGAGFTVGSDVPRNLRFRVGPRQWLDFIPAADFNGMRRLQFVTCGTDRLDEVGRALRARGVAIRWLDADQGRPTLELTDPAGNRIHVQEARTTPLPPLPREAAFSGHLQHMGFAVDRRQAEETIGFYRERLGFAETLRLENSDGRLGLIKFRVPGPGRELIELILYDLPLDPWAAGAFDHVNFEVADINHTYGFLHRRGLATLARHRPQVNGEHLWAINLTDPELTRIEVLVLTPTSVPIGTVSAVGGPP